MKHLICPAEFKADGDKGQFSGYASIFGNVDLGGDVVTKDAFKEIVANEAGQVKVLFQHDSMGRTPSGGLPIGLATVEQNAKGLKFSGSLVMDDPFVQRVHTHMKAGTLSGMSIGFDVLPGGARLLESGVRELSGLKLWEISPVTFGMNPKAGIMAVKGGGVMTLREYEEHLSEHLWDANVKGGRLSRDDIKLLAARGWKGFEEARDASDPEKQAKAAIAGMTEYLQGLGKPK